jgi:hypothetical protein
MVTPPTDKQKCQGHEEKAHADKPVQRPSHLAGASAQEVG